MINNYLENINNACSDHEKALEIYHDHLEAKKFSSTLLKSFMRSH